MANTAAIVTQVEGQAWLRHKDGSLEVLRAGMRIPVDAEVVTAAGSKVILQGDESGALQIAENQQITLSAELLQAAEPSEAAIAQPAGQDVNALITALNAGQDPLNELDPTEAVLSGGEGAGSTYVRLANVLESTTPLSLQYPRSFGLQDRDFLSGGGAIEQDNASTPVPSPVAGVQSDAQSVFEAGLGNDADSTEVARGSLAVSASDGIKEVSIDDVTYTLSLIHI